MIKKQHLSPKWHILNDLNPQETAHLSAALNSSRKSWYSGKTKQLAGKVRRGRSACAEKAEAWGLSVCWAPLLGYQPALWAQLLGLGIIKKHGFCCWNRKVSCHWSNIESWCQGFLSQNWHHPRWALNLGKEGEFFLSPCCQHIPGKKGG